MRSTVTIHNNRKHIAHGHNIRDRSICENEKHIDLDNIHGQSIYELWHGDGSVIQGFKPLRERYKDIFGAAIEEYNSKQKRKDRRMDIDDYMQSILDDTRGNRQTKIVNGKRVVDENGRVGKQLEYETTVKIGNCTLSGYDNNQHEIRESYFPRDLQKRILKRYAKEFGNRNLNSEKGGFCLTGIYYHGDEGYTNRKGEWEYSTDHLHITYIPVANGFKTGLSVQNSMNKALKALGCDSYKDWVDREQAYLEEITKDEYAKYCKENPDFYRKSGELEIIHPIRDHDYDGDKEKEVYVAEKRVEADKLEVIRDKAKIDKKAAKIHENVAELNERIKTHNAKSKALNARTEAVNERERQLNEREANIESEIQERVQRELQSRIARQQQAKATEKKYTKQDERFDDLPFDFLK